MTLDQKLWTTDIPTEPDHYWFYGCEIVGQMGQDFTADRKFRLRLSLVRIRRIGDGALMGVTNGHFVALRKFDPDTRSEGMTGYWMPAERPTPPEDFENLFGPNAEAKD